MAAVPAGVREHPDVVAARRDQQHGDVADRHRPLGDAPAVVAGTQARPRDRRRSRCRRRGGAAPRRAPRREVYASPGSIVRLAERLQSSAQTGQSIVAAWRSAVVVTRCIVRCCASIAVRARMGRRKVEVRREEILARRSPRSWTERDGGHARRRRRRRRSASAAALVFYHFDTKDALLVEAFEYAVERDLDRLDKRHRAKGSDPVEQLRRVLASYGPTGAAHGWRMWIDAWATALREPAIRRRRCASWTSAGATRCRTSIDAGRRRRRFTCADPDGARGPRRGAARRPRRWRRWSTRDR